MVNKQMNPGMNNQDCGACEYAPLGASSKATLQWLGR